MYCSKTTAPSAKISAVVFKKFMPAVSRAQRIAMAIAEHHPGKLDKKNKGLLKMSHEKLHEFAATSEKGLPYVKKAMRKRK